MSASIQLEIGGRVLDGVLYAGSVGAEVLAALPLALRLEPRRGALCARLRRPLALNVERSARAPRPGELVYSPAERALCVQLVAPPAGDGPALDPVGALHGDLGGLGELAPPVEALLRRRETGTYARG